MNRNNKFFHNSLEQKLVRNGHAKPYNLQVHKRIVSALINFQAAGPWAFSQNKKIHFDNDPRIDNSRVVAIEVVGLTSLTVTTANPPKDSLGPQLLQGYITIKNKTGEILLQEPLLGIDLKSNDNKLYFTNWVNVDWQASYIRFPAAAIISADNGILFKIYLSDK